MKNEVIKIENIKNNKREFPFKEVPTSRWILSFLAVIALFALPNIAEIENRILLSIILILTSVIPALIVDKRFFKEVIKPVKIKDIFLIIITIILSFVVAITMANLLKGSNLADNPVKDLLNPENIYLLLGFTLLSLMAEEILFVIPFLFVYNKTKANKTIKTIVAIIISSVIFGLAHLWAYNFNIVQCLGVIGTLRIVVSMPYVLRKNLLLTYLTHVLYDWIIFISIYYETTKGLI